MRTSNILRLWRKIIQFLSEDVGITRHIIPHDLRRTTAVGMLEATGDLRDVQALLGHRSLASTISYLDHDFSPINRATLELIKLKASIACFAQRIQLEVFDGRDGSQLPHAAQVAISVHREAKRKKK